MIDKLLAGVSILASIFVYVVIPASAIYFHNNYIPFLGVIILFIFVAFLYRKQKKLDYKINEQLENLKGLNQYFERLEKKHYEN